MTPQMVQGEAVRRRILAYFEERETKRLPLPSIREIGMAVGLSSSSTVLTHLRRLAESGELEFDPGKARSYRLTQGRRFAIAMREFTGWRQRWLSTNPEYVEVSAFTAWLASRGLAS